MRIRYKHFRISDADGRTRQYSRSHKWQGDQPTERGGMTTCNIAVIYDDLNVESHSESYSFDGTSVCSKQDNYSYAEGRRKALIRATQEFVRGYTPTEAADELHKELLHALMMADAELDEVRANTTNKRIKRQKKQKYLQLKQMVKEFKND